MKAYALHKCMIAAMPQEQKRNKQANKQNNFIIRRSIPMSPDVLVTLIFSVFIEISLIEGGLDQPVLIGGCSPLAEVIGPLYHQLDIILLLLIGIISTVVAILV